MALFNFKAPALPDKLLEIVRALRLYFNRLDGDLATLSSPLGAAELNCPAALYYSTQTQTAVATNTAYKISFNNVYFQNGMEITGTPQTRITVQKSGIYNFQFTGILVSGSSSQKDAWIWIRRNGTDIGYSGIPATNTENNGHHPISWNFNIDVDAGSYIEIMWATSSTDLYFDSETPSSPYPGHSSAVMAVQFVTNTDGFSVATAP